MPKPFGFNVIGHVSGNLGLGVTARVVVQVLLDKQFAVSVFDVDPGMGRGKKDLRFESLVSEQLPYAVNLAVLPPPTLSLVTVKHRELLVDPEYFNAAWTIWELPIIPGAWRSTLEFFDALVAQSAFIRQTLANALPAPTLAALHPLYLPAGVSPDRRRFAVDDDDVVYVTSLELASDPARKNVLGTLKAFERGLAGVPSARLLIRVNNAHTISPDNRVLGALQAAVLRDPRIRLVTEPMDYSGVLSLYASSDVFVSLHRSEGLGLGPMEAMALGKAVVATGWSGNMEYMDNTNACLVPYTLVPAAGMSGGEYSRKVIGSKAYWADPDIGAAALWMRRLAEDPALRRSIGERARIGIAEFHETALGAKFAFEIQALWDHRRYTARLPTLESRRAALNAVSRASREPLPRASGGLARFRRATTRTLDRHLLWRFRRTN